MQKNPLERGRSLYASVSVSATPNAARVAPPHSRTQSRDKTKPPYLATQDGYARCRSFDPRATCGGCGCERLQLGECDSLSGATKDAITVSD